MIGCDNTECTERDICQRWKVYELGECEKVKRYDYDTQECLIFADSDSEAGAAEADNALPDSQHIHTRATGKLKTGSIGVMGGVKQGIKRGMEYTTKSKKM